MLWDAFHPPCIIKTNPPEVIPIDARVEPSTITPHRFLIYRLTYLPMIAYAYPSAQASGLYQSAFPIPFPHRFQHYVGPEVLRRRYNRQTSPASAKKERNRLIASTRPLLLLPLPWSVPPPSSIPAPCREQGLDGFESSFVRSLRVSEPG